MKTRSVKPPYCVRQGDVCLVDADYRGNKDGIIVPATERGNVLAHGELTGHAHVIERENVAIFDAAGERFVQIIENLAPLKVMSLLIRRFHICCW